MPIVPVAKPAMILVANVGFSPGFNSPAIIVLTGTYRPILKPANTICLYNPAVKPLYKAKNPSSLDIVPIVPRKPEYLGLMVGSTCLAWIWSLTLAVSMGIVAISATQAAVDAASTFFKKNLTTDSPSALYVFILLSVLY